MDIPQFYIAPALAAAATVLLPEDTARHIGQVLRMQPGDMLRLSDGIGSVYTATLVEVQKKAATVQITGQPVVAPQPVPLVIGISLVKNAARFEWFLEKATEIGVTHIIPMQCTRTEKHHFRADRMKNILISAMIQSQQSWLPELEEPTPFPEVLRRPLPPGRFIAHCIDEEKKPLPAALDRTVNGNCMLIGPEGDFTSAEISAALENGFQPVSLGATRLRTETAGMVAVTLLRNL